MSVKIEVSDEVINADVITLCNPLAVKKAVVIPENPTNGDVIKTLFHCLEKYEYEEPYTHGIALAGNDNRVTWFTNDWWNAPYKAEKSGEVLP